MPAKVHAKMARKYTWEKLKYHLMEDQSFNSVLRRKIWVAR